MQNSQEKALARLLTIEEIINVLDERFVLSFSEGAIELGFRRAISSAYKDRYNKDLQIDNETYIALLSVLGLSLMSNNSTVHGVRVL